jgi:hypothetical protein
MTEASLTDDQRTAYVNEYAEGNTVPGGYKGEISFSPGPPAHALELSLGLGQNSLPIPLNTV